MPQRARVLVIEDDPLFRSVISTLLRGEYIVQVASEGSEGFFRALEEPPDIAVIDLRMPNWDGLKTLKAFRAHPSLSNVKIVMLSAHATGQTTEAAMQAGADDFVIKTRFGPDELLRKLARLLPAETNAESAADGHAGADLPFANGNLSANQIADRRSQTENRANARLQAILDDWD